ncbi:MAG: fasciclin domain-containing protein [Elainellaceae cyanobacterium]
MTTRQIAIKLAKKVGLAAGLLGLSIAAPSAIAQTAIASNHTDGASTMEESTEGGAMMDEAEPGMGSGMSADMSIVDVASGSESFNTLVQAVQAAGLADTLAGEGPYTVFAPTDEAFEQLPDGVLEALLEPENREILQQILRYHVASGELVASDISTGTIPVLTGGGVAVRVAEDRIIVNNGSVVQPNIEAGNGVIHGVNRVLLPPPVQQQLDTLMSE